MITRYALFEGSVRPGKTDAFRAAVLDRLVPLWKQFAGAQEVRVMFGEDRDEGRAGVSADPGDQLSGPGRHGRGAAKPGAGRNPARPRVRSSPNVSMAAFTTM